MEEDFSVMIAIPTMGDVSIIFTQALIEMIFETQKRFNCEIKIETVVRQMHHRARTELANRFLDSDCDYILWLDDDNIPKKDDLIKLLERNLPLVSGLYFRRTKPYEPIIMVNKENGVGTERRSDIYRNRDGLVKIHSTGMGFMLVKKEVIEKTRELGVVLFDVRGQIGEDIWFCTQVQTAGYPIWLDTNVVIGHLGERELVVGDTYDNYYNKNILGLVEESMEIDGWMEHKELIYLSEMASYSKFTIEVGSYKGRSAVVLSNSDKLFCVDSWENDEIFKEFLQNIRGNTQYIKGNSDDIAEQFKDYCADLIFIDGGHDYNQVKKDLNNYWKKLKVGGKMCLHDYIYPKFGVKEAVDEFIKENPFCIGKQIKDTSIYELVKF